MHIFQKVDFFPPETDFFLNLTQRNVQMFIKVLDRPATCLWVFQIKMKWNLIFYRISEILDFHFLFHGRQKDLGKINFTWNRTLKLLTILLSKIQDVKVVGSLHKPYGKCTYDPLNILLSVFFDQFWHLKKIVKTSYPTLPSFLQAVALNTDLFVFWAILRNSHS